MTPQHFQKPFGCKQVFDSMVGRCMPNSGYWVPPGNKVMTIFVFYVSAQTPNIVNFDVYGGLWAPGGISSFFSSNFLSNAGRIMSGDLFLTRIMTIFINVYILEIAARSLERSLDRSMAQGVQDTRSRISKLVRTSL